MNVVKKRRTQLKLTQRNLSIWCNVKQSYISQIENNTKVPSLRFVLILSNNLKLCPVLILKEYICEKCKYKNTYMCKFL